MLFEHLAELELGVKLLAGNDGDVHVALDRRQRVYVFRQHRLFVPERAVAFYLAPDAPRVHGRQPAVHLDQDVHVRPDRFSHGAHVLYGGVLNVLADEGAPWAGYRVELHRGETHFDHLPRAVGEGFGRGVAAAPAVGVNPYPAAASSADEHMDGHISLLAGDVPQRVFDAADRAPEVHRAPPSGEVVVRPLEEVLDVARVPPDEIAAHLVNVRRHLNVAVRLGVRFAPAVYPLIRLHLHEAEILPPSGVRQKVFDIGDLHGELRSLE